MESLSTRRRVNTDPHEELEDAVAVSRFWRSVKVAGVNECWPWDGYLDDDGYGLFFWRGKRRPAHELALSFSIGEKRHPSLDTCHSCDNPVCCNPLHLRFDTRKSNVGEMYERGRENNPAQLTDDQVRLIRERRALGARQIDLAEQFNCSAAYISTLIRGVKRLSAGGPIETKRKYNRG